MSNLSLEKEAIKNSIRKKAIAIVHNLGKNFDNRFNFPFNDDCMECNPGAIGYVFKCPDLTITLFEGDKAYGCIIQTGCWESTPANDFREVYSDYPAYTLGEKFRKIFQNIQPVEIYEPGDWEKVLDTLFHQASQTSK